MTRDVTNAVQRIRNTYGGSDNTNERNASANKSINYTSGNTISSANERRVTVVPSSFEITGEVGLFGVENDFIKVDLNILNTSGVSGFQDSDGYFQASTDRIDEPNAIYNPAVLDDTLDTTTVNDYDPASVLENLSNFYLPVIDIQLENQGTNNIYVDSHVDVTLYSEDRRPIGSDYAFVATNGCFFVGIHARKNRRLPYRVSLTLGERFASLLDLNASERDSVLTKLGSSY